MVGYWLICCWLVFVVGWLFVGWFDMSSFIFVVLQVFGCLFGGFEG